MRSNHVRSAAHEDPAHKPRPSRMHDPRRPCAFRWALASECLLTWRAERLAPFALITLMTCIATVLSPDNSPLFMVAGDLEGPVGSTIGFVGNVIDPKNVADSTVRASLVYTVAWIPVAAISGIAALGQGVSSPTTQLSQARGIPGGTALAARTLPGTLSLAVFYAISVIVSFILKSQGCDMTLTDAPWASMCATALTNCVLLCAIYASSACIGSLLKAPLIAAAIAFALHIGPLIAYPNAYLDGRAPGMAWVSPTVSLMHTCSLNVAGTSYAAIAATGLAVIGASLVLMYVAGNHQEACR